MSDTIFVPTNIVQMTGGARFILPDDYRVAKDFDLARKIDIYYFTGTGLEIELRLPWNTPDCKFFDKFFAQVAEKPT